MSVRSCGPATLRTSTGSRYVRPFHITAADTRCYRPVGAFNLVRLLTGDTSSGGCCNLFVQYLRQAVPHGLTGKPCEARRNAILEIDASSSSGKFMAARFTMANMVEKTSIRVWTGVSLYMLAAIVYIRTRGAEVRSALDYVWHQQQRDPLITPIFGILHSTKM